MNKDLDNKLTLALTNFSCNFIYKDAINSISTEVAKTAPFLPNITTSEWIKETTANICSSISARVNTKTQITSSNKTLLNRAFLQAANDPLFDNSCMNDSTNSIDACDARPSIIFKQTVDESIFDIMKSSEDTTWKTLDIIHSKLKENSEALDLIKEHILKYAPTNVPDSGTNIIRSPIMETIIYDAIEQITSDVSFIKKQYRHKIHHQLIAQHQSIFMLLVLLTT